MPDPYNYAGSDMGLSENLEQLAKKENESGKSSEFLSLIRLIQTYLGYGQLAKPGAVELSDTPDMFFV